MQTILPEHVRDGTNFSRVNLVKAKQVNNFIYATNLITLGVLSGIYEAEKN